MKILVINAGSSSLKYQLFNMENRDVLAKGICERIGVDGNLAHKTIDGRTLKQDFSITNHDDAIKLVIETLTTGKYAVIDDVSEIDAIGQRIAHGVEIKDSSLLDKETMEYLQTTQKMAPLHNPPVIKGILACQKIMPTVPQVGVFDTTFYASVPDYNYIYPLPYELYKAEKIRKYGFHGTSHRYVAQSAAEFLGKDIKELKIVSCHLGSGSSITAVKDGKAMNTTMGFTPLDGLMMGTRCGSIDPAIVTHLIKEGRSVEEVDDLMNKQSGFIGITGGLSDWRDVCASAEDGDSRGILAQQMICHQVRRYIGSFTADMGGIDVLIFTAGIGENSYEMRELVTNEMEFFGIEIDKELNKDFTRDINLDISSKNSRVKVLIIPTNEEYMIAKDTAKVVNK